MKDFSRRVILETLHILLQKSYKQRWHYIYMCLGLLYLCKAYVMDVTFFLFERGLFYKQTKGKLRDREENVNG